MQRHPRREHMVLKADCIRRLDPWSELGARVSEGGGTAAGRAARGRRLCRVWSRRAACSDWLSLHREPGRTRTEADRRGTEVAGPTFLGAVLTTQV